MIELSGKYAAAKVFTDVVDNESISQVIGLLNQPFVEGSTVRMMPDIHAGAGCTIGTTMTVSDKICPNLVGVDIGCGMELIRVSTDHMDLQRLDRVIREGIPSGFQIRSEEHRYLDRVRLDDLCCAHHVNLDRARLSVGTLGGGNHFIEADRDEEGNLYVVIHSGSRHLGVNIATYYQNEAYKRLSSVGKDALEETITKLKAEGRQREIEAAVKAIKVKKPHVQKDLAYCEGDLLQDYLHDMQIAQEYADVNRQAMMDVIVKGMGLQIEDRITTIHNYIDLEHMILRKGAVSAQAGERLLIPINMRDGSLLCTGKGNPDWNYSAPHGAGRLMSRAAAKERFTVEEFEAQMQDVYSTSVNSSTLDECPMAYKPMQSILDNIGPTVSVDAVLKPIYNFKAGEE